jgi:hypothetical protein
VLRGALGDVVTVGLAGSVGVDRLRREVGVAVGLIAVREVGMRDVAVIAMAGIAVIVVRSAVRMVTVQRIGVVAVPAACVACIHVFGRTRGVGVVGVVAVGSIDVFVPAGIGVQLVPVRRVEMFASSCLEISVSGVAVRPISVVTVHSVAAVSPTACRGDSTERDRHRDRPSGTEQRAPRELSLPGCSLRVGVDAAQPSPLAVTSGVGVGHVAVR